MIKRFRFAEYQVALHDQRQNRDWDNVPESYKNEIVKHHKIKVKYPRNIAKIYKWGIKGSFIINVATFFAGFVCLIILTAIKIFN
jgi:hypothetical protein